jgi:hypothetical protein
VLPWRDRVHADAVAEQRTARALATRVDADHRDPQRVALIEPQPPHQLVSQARLARTTCAGHTEHGRFAALGCSVQLLANSLGHLPVLERADQLRQRAPSCVAMPCERFQLGMREAARCERPICAHQHVADHAAQAHALTVFRAVDPHAALTQRADLGGDDHAASASEHLNVLAAAFAQQLDHVGVVLIVSTLVATDCDALNIFLQRRRHNLLDRAVVSQVNDLRTHALHDAAHDVDRGVVTVKQARRSDKPQLVRRQIVRERVLCGGQIGHRLSPSRDSIAQPHSPARAASSACDR